MVRERDSARNSERVSPAVLRIMRIQSDPVKSAILVGLKEIGSTTQLRLRTGDPLENIPPSTISHSVVDLENENLLRREGGNLKITDLGRVSVEALIEFQASVSPHLLKSHLRKLEEVFGTDAACEFAGKFEGQAESSKFRSLPAVLRLMKIGSDATRLAVLQALMEREPLSFKNLLLAVETNSGSKLPGSTLSNLLKELSNERLLDNQARGSVIQLTDTGDAVLLAFEQFHQRLREPASYAIREKFERDFGLQNLQL